MLKAGGAKREGRREQPSDPWRGMQLLGRSELAAAQPKAY